MAYQLLHTLTELHKTPATIDEEDSYYVSLTYEQDNPQYVKYTTKDLSLDEITQMCNSFALFTAKIKDMEDNQYPSYFPINVFRYVLHEDLSYSNYYTPKRKHGYIVEGSYWSNGMFYQVREDKDQNFEIHEVVFYVDRITQVMSNYPEISNG